LTTMLILSIGAVLGANLRYWLSGWILERWGADFPYHTMVINLTGSLLLGFFITVSTTRFLVNPEWRLFFAIGILGSYTTFSTYTFESIVLLTAGEWRLGLFNLFGSSALGGLATVAGVLLGRLL
jgi:fluoride exporter